MTNEEVDLGAPITGVCGANALVVEQDASMVAAATTARMVEEAKCVIVLLAGSASSLLGIPEDDQTSNKAMI